MINYEEITPEKQFSDKKKIKKSKKSLKYRYTVKELLAMDNCRLGSFLGEKGTICREKVIEMQTRGAVKVNIHYLRLVLKKGKIERKKAKSEPKLTTDELLILILNKQLEQHNVDVNYVKSNPEVDGMPWYQYYTFKTRKDFDEWKEFSINAIMTRLDQSYSRETANKEFNMINLFYGLKPDYPEFE